ncbi:MAG: putative two-component system response regulator [Edaphobacter sp.]|jgi:two-component system NarL family response regulator|nr:putative two-component system response regulator [Edaphobacter sp.]
MVAVINRQPDMQVITEASNGHEAVEQFLSILPDVGLLDLRMPILDGIEAIRFIRRDVPSARLVVLTSYETDEDIYRALRAGAQGYLFKCCAKEELLECIRAISRGRSWIPPDVGAKLAKRVVAPDLTRRETDVLEALSIGRSNKEIGALFDISEATVKVHMTHILEKLRVSSRAEAINVATGRGLVRL